jgi:hypothetical protein
MGSSSVHISEGSEKSGRKMCRFTEETATSRNQAWFVPYFFWVSRLQLRMSLYWLGFKPPFSHMPRNVYIGRLVFFLTDAATLFTFGSFVLIMTVLLSSLHLRARYIPAFSVPESSQIQQ